MTSRKRHHYVPRFLLARFASRREGKKSWVWQISHDTAVEISTRDAAVSEHFYGRDATIEDPLGPLETAYAAALRRLDSGESPEAHRQTLRELLWTLVIRGKSLRDQFARFGSQMARSTVASLAGEPGRRALQASLDNQFDEQLDDMLAAIPPDLAHVRALFDSPEAREQLRALAGQMIDRGDLSSLIGTLFNDEVVEKAGEDAARRGQLKGMGRMIHEGVSPSAFDPVAWDVVRFPSAALLLGDTCVIGSDESGDTGSMLRMSDRWNAVYLPISPSAVLVGWRTERGALLDEHRLALASWELSEDYVYAHCENPSVRQAQAPSFGARANVMDDDELQALLDQHLNEIAQR